MNEQEAKQQAATLVQRIKKEPEFMYNNVGWDVYKFLTVLAQDSGPIPGKQMTLPFEDDITPEEQVLRDFTLASDLCDDNVNVHTTKDAVTGVVVTVYEVGDHYYTEAEFNALWPEFNKPAQEEVHDERIYEDELNWRGDPTHGQYAQFPSGAVYCNEDIKWRIECTGTTLPGRHFIFETDLDIKWEDEK